MPPGARRGRDGRCHAALPLDERVDRGRIVREDVLERHLLFLGEHAEQHAAAGREEVLRQFREGPSRPAGGNRGLLHHITALERKDLAGEFGHTRGGDATCQEEAVELAADDDVVDVRPPEVACVLRVDELGARHDIWVHGLDGERGEDRPLVGLGEGVVPRFVGDEHRGPGRVHRSAAEHRFACEVPAHEAQVHAPVTRCALLEGFRVHFVDEHDARLAPARHTREPLEHPLSVPVPPADDEVVPQFRVLQALALPDLAIDEDARDGTREHRRHRDAGEDEQDPEQAAGRGHGVRVPIPHSRPGDDRPPHRVEIPPEHAAFRAAFDEKDQPGDDEHQHDDAGHHPGKVFAFQICVQRTEAAEGCGDRSGR
jgi:hypothetical protein